MRVGGRKRQGDWFLVVGLWCLWWVVYARSSELERVFSPKCSNEFVVKSMLWIKAYSTLTHGEMTFLEYTYQLFKKVFKITVCYNSCKVLRKWAVVLWEVGGWLMSRRCSYFVDWMIRTHEQEWARIRNENLDNLFMVEGVTWDLSCVWGECTDMMFFFENNDDGEGDDDGDI